jgi:hypothetical protein
LPFFAGESMVACHLADSEPEDAADSGSATAVSR